MLGLYPLGSVALGSVALGSAAPSATVQTLQGASVTVVTSAKAMPRMGLSASIMAQSRGKVTATATAAISGTASSKTTLRVPLQTGGGIGLVGLAISQVKANAGKTATAPLKGTVTCQVSGDTTKAFNAALAGTAGIATKGQLQAGAVNLAGYATTQVVCSPGATFATPSGTATLVGRMTCQFKAKVPWRAGYYWYDQTEEVTDWTWSIPVNSALIQCIEYSLDAQILAVDFQAGYTINYQNVSYAIASQFSSAVMRGIADQYYRNAIAGHFTPMLKWWPGTAPTIVTGTVALKGKANISTRGKAPASVGNVGVFGTAGIATWGSASLSYSGTVNLGGKITSMVTGMGAPGRASLPSTGTAQVKAYCGIGATCALSNTLPLGGTTPTGVMLHLEGRVTLVASAANRGNAIFGVMGKADIAVATGGNAVSLPAKATAQVSGKLSTSTGTCQLSGSGLVAATGKAAQSMQSALSGIARQRVVGEVSMATQTSASPRGDKLPYSPPALNSPLTITLSQAGPNNYNAGGRDVLLQFPQAGIVSAPNTAPCTSPVYICNVGNLVCIGGSLIPSTSVAGGASVQAVGLGGAPTLTCTAQAALHIANATGVVYIEGLYMNPSVGGFPTVGGQDAVHISSFTTGSPVTVVMQNCNVNYVAGDPSAIQSSVFVTNDVPPSGKSLPALWNQLFFDHCSFATQCQGLTIPNNTPDSNRQITGPVFISNTNIRST